MKSSTSFEVNLELFEPVNDYNFVPCGKCRECKGKKRPERCPNSTYVDVQEYRMTPLGEHVRDFLRIFYGLRSLEKPTETP